MNPTDIKSLDKVMFQVKDNNGGSTYRDVVYCLILYEWNPDWDW